MTMWQRGDVQALVGPDEIEIALRRTDGTLRSPRIIWIVAVGDRVFVRSTNGRGASWFKAATATGGGRITARGRQFDVTLSEVDAESDLAAVDSAYREKYRRYASIVAHLAEAGPRAATLEVTPV